MTLSRRSFLAGLGASGALAASGYGVFAWTRDEEQPDVRTRAVTRQTAKELGPGIAGRTLVILEFAGGNDALSMVVPYGDARYRQLRPSLAVADPIDLDGSVGLSPRLTHVAEQYRAGRVAIVQGVGVDQPDLSHFESLHRWWTGDPSETTATGWLGRYLDATVGFDDPLAGISIGPGPSPALTGTASFATAIADASGLQPGRLDADVADALLEAWGSFVPKRLAEGMFGEVQQAIAETLVARDRLTAALGPARAPAARGRARPTMAESLTLAARLAAADVAPRVIHVHAGGDFDTHQGQAGGHDALMQSLDEAIAAFVVTLDELGLSDRVVLATTSEFGRRVQENGTGTDHGTAAAHLVLGNVVASGLVGDAPSLSKLDADDNLVPTVQLRAYLAGVLGWLGVEPEPILGPVKNPIPIF